MKKIKVKKKKKIVKKKKKLKKERALRIIYLLRMNPKIKKAITKKNS